MKKPKIIFLTGVSGAGKTTMMDALLSHFPQTEKILSVTTRAPRNGEKNGDQYHFVSSEEFEQWKLEKRFLEYAFVHNSYYYGTRLDWLEESLEKWYYPIKNIDPLGMEMVQHEGQIDDKYMCIFMDISDELMVKRIYERQPNISDEELQKRLASAQHERIIAQKLPHCILVDASPEREAVFANLVNILELGEI